MSCIISCPFIDTDFCSGFIVPLHQAPVLPLTHQSTAKCLRVVDAVSSHNGDQIISAGHKLIAKVLSGCNSDSVRNAKNNK